MEFDDHDEHEEEAGSTHTNSVRAKTAGKQAPRYRECQKNHAVGIGGHALDGCGEFMPAGEENTLDALKCAACTCHRNFHRKESSSEGGRELGFIQHHLHPHHQQYLSPYYRTPAAGYVHLAPPHYGPSPALALPSTSGGGAATDPEEQEEDVSNPSGGGGGGMGKKRFRTKFTAEQKDKMLAFAESLGWRIQKHDEAAVEEFCREACVKRQVLKVWMHNNKHTLGKKP